MSVKKSLIAIVSIVSIVITAGALFYSYYGDRPVVTVSLEQGDTGFPSYMINKIGEIYQIGISVENSGKRDGEVIFIATGTNVKVSFDNNGTWSYNDSSSFIISPHPSKITQLYLLPDINATKIIVKLSLNKIVNREYFEEANMVGPDTVQFSKVGPDFIPTSDTGQGDNALYSPNEIKINVTK